MMDDLWFRAGAPAGASGIIEMMSESPWRSAGDVLIESWHCVQG